MAYVVQQTPVTATPAVDALFDIANDEVLATFMAHRLLKQDTEVLPLDGGCVLELVNHDVLQLCADLLEDKRRVAVADEGMEQLLCIAEQEAVRLLIQLTDLGFNATQESQLVEVT